MCAIGIKAVIVAVPIEPSIKVRFLALDLEGKLLLHVLLLILLEVELAVLPQVPGRQIECQRGHRLPILLSVTDALCQLFPVGFVAAVVLKLDVQVERHV